MERFISMSPEFPDDLRQILQNSPLITVSGQPLARYSASGKETLLGDCEYVFDVVLAVHTAVMKTIPLAGYRHLPPEFLGTYPIVIGFEAGSGDEYIFGVHRPLGTEIIVGTEVDHA